MKNNFIGCIDPNLYTTSAFAIGLLLVNELNTLEQNSFANWLYLVAQTLETNSAQEQLISSNTDKTNINHSDLLEKVKHIFENEIKKNSQ